MLLRILCGWLLSAPAWGTALANTEIVNFVANQVNDAIIPRSTAWPVLHRDQNEGQWSLPPAPLNTALEDVCAAETDSNNDGPHQLWVILDLNHDDWRRYSKFTLRLSWPASNPADFLVQVYDPLSLSARFPGPNVSRPLYNGTGTLTRNKYAHIRPVNTGVLPDRSTKHHDVFPRITRSIPFNLIVEPLYLGVLPASVLPVLLFMLLILLLACLALPTTFGYFEKLAHKARQEISAREKDE